MFSFKKCCFRNCSTNPSTANCTLFSFPKDPHRQQQWLEIAQCSTASKPKDQYICEKHFDAKKYISITPRRKILTSTAIPEFTEHGERVVIPVADDGRNLFQQSQIDAQLQIPQLQSFDSPLATQRLSSPFISSSIIDESSVVDIIEGTADAYEIHSNIDIDLDEKSIVQQTQSEVLEIDTNSMDDEPVYLDLTDGQESDNFLADNSKRTTTVDNANETVIGEENSYSGDATADIIYYDATSSSRSFVGPSINKPMGRLRVSNINGTRNHITTFIDADGVEYIKMPKKSYLKERERLYEQLSRYRTILRRIKRQVNAVVL